MNIWYLLIQLARRTFKSADSAIVSVTVNMESNAIYVRDIVAGKMHYDEFLTNVITACKDGFIRTLGVEVTGLHEFITQPIKNELTKAGLQGQVDFLELIARGGTEGEKGKISRIRSLIPFYRQGHVFHNPACGHLLESQLRDFPAAKLWDIMDAFSYIIEALALGERFMQPVHKVEDKMFDMTKEDDEFERQMAELENEAPLDDIYHW